MAHIQTKERPFSSAVRPAHRPRKAVVPLRAIDAPGDMSLSQSAATRIAPRHLVCTDMDDYAIRILKENGRQLVIEARLMGDHAAIRRATTLATAGDQLEVWRGMTCIYSTLESLAIH